MLHTFKTAIFLLALGLACSGRMSPTDSGASTPKPETAYAWTQLLDSAPWRKNYNFQLFSHRDTLWAFHPDGAWFSEDGTDWAQSALPNAIRNYAFLDYVQFGQSILGLGHFEGNIEKYHFRPAIYRTDDLKSWHTLAEESNLPRRFFYHPFVFDHKIWIIGGEDSRTQYADIWNSPDGVHWTRQKDNLPFGKRSGSQFVFLNGKIFLLNNDVWSSTDGLTWTLETPEIVPGEEIFGYAALVYNEEIWLLGCNRNGQFTSQVLTSPDGKNWTGRDAPWSPRGGIAACVHRGKIYMTGGKYGGTPEHTEFVYSNDLWTCTADLGSAKNPNLQPEDLALTASTPGDSLIKSLLGIPHETRCDFIRWDLTLKPDQNNAGSFSLNIRFGESQPNTLGFKGGGQSRSLEGEWQVVHDSKSEVYQLKCGQWKSTLSLLRIHKNLFHILTPDNRLMVGNGGWSYNLNRKIPLPVDGASLPKFIGQTVAAGKFPVEAVYDGRTPCREIAEQYNVPVEGDCFKLKWRLILYRDPATGDPAGYTINRVQFQRAVGQGKWAIVRGTGQNEGAVIYQLDPDQPGKSLSFLAADENILFFLDKNQQPLTGNGDFSFTLNKHRRPPVDGK